MNTNHQIFVPATIAKSRCTVSRMYPGGSVIAKVEGGHIVFGSIAQYKQWKNQK